MRSEKGKEEDGEGKKGKRDVKGEKGRVRTGIEKK